MNAIKSALCAIAALTGSLAFAAGIDIQQSPTDFFVPTDAQKYDSPYYRYDGADWGWTHGAVDTTGAVSAELNISAFDVDFTSPGYVGERDLISAWDTDTASWVSLGFLAGGNDIWAFSVFNLSLATFSNEIASGLKVKIDIDQSGEGWAVTLTKSVLTVDGGRLPPPTPGGSVPDSASSLLLCVAGFMAVAVSRRKLV